MTNTTVDYKHACVTKPYNLILTKGQWCSVAGTVTHHRPDRE